MKGEVDILANFPIDTSLKKKTHSALLQRRHLLQQQLQDDVDTRFYWNTGVAVQFLRMLSHNSCITLIEACCVFLLLYFQWGGGGGGRRISIKLQCLQRTVANIDYQYRSSEKWPVLIVLYWLYNTVASIDCPNLPVASGSCQGEISWGDHDFVLTILASFQLHMVSLVIWTWYIFSMSSFKLDIFSF